MSNHLKPLGFVGIGLMGNRLVKRLIEKEYTVNIYDKNKNFILFIFFLLKIQIY